MTTRLCFKYYSRSSRLVRGLLVAAALSLGAGCASASSLAAGAPRLAYAEAAKGTPAAIEALSRMPVVIAFHEGDVIPFELAVESMLFAQQPSPTTTSFVAKRGFFVLMREDAPPRISLDGVDFDQRRGGSFSAGLGVTPAGAKGAVRVAFWPETKAP